jgi:histidinol-phosphate aminotransferase
MYNVAANINNVKIKEISLTEDFEINLSKVLSSISSATKLIFICSPNNPTGNCMKATDIKKIINNFNGLVILDEAYIDFAEESSFLKHLYQYPNLVIMQTFSKAWGLAGIRLGMAFADKFIIDILNKVKPPYNVNYLTQEKALEALNNLTLKNNMVSTIISQRKILEKELKEMPFVKKIYPSDSNFLLVKTTHANDIYNFLVKKSIIVRNRTNVSLCLNSLRITVGTEDENRILLDTLKKFN